jgi:hypothetical protein
MNRLIVFNSLIDRYTKIGKYIPNDRKIYQIIPKFPFQGLQKYTLIGIFGMQILIPSYSHAGNMF